MCAALEEEAWGAAVGEAAVSAWEAVARAWEVAVRALEEEACVCWRTAILM